MTSLRFRFGEYRWLKFPLIMGLAVVAGIALSLFFNGGRSLQSTPSPLAGGATTVFNRSSRAFSQPASGLTPAELDQHTEGDVAFDAVYVTAPATVNPGLGPKFNNASCTGCHLRDGRGMPEPGQSLVRISLPQGKPEVPGGAVPVPEIGTQIREQAIYGDQPDAKVLTRWQEQVGTYGDGTGYQLRSPHLTITLPNGQPLPGEVLTSLRVPPPVFGRGLLEAIPEQTILSLADPDDRNQDGISGRPNQVWDVREKATVLGRFGLKANTPTLLQQTAAAFVNDMGITNPLFPERDGTADIDQKTLETTTFYGQSLGVPARTLLGDSLVKQGEKLFTQANCTACHIAELRTGNYPIPVMANQTIHPYTDLLLHDMGTALADGRPDFEASGSEWRTPPLWGIGLTQTVLPYSGYLHDGRARTLEEAILWHGGEAEQSREIFRVMNKGDRKALLRFLNSL